MFTETANWPRADKNWLQALVKILRPIAYVAASMPVGILIVLKVRMKIWLESKILILEARCEQSGMKRGEGGSIGWSPVPSVWKSHKYDLSLRPFSNSLFIHFRPGEKNICCSNLHQWKCRRRCCCYSHYSYVPERFQLQYRRTGESVAACARCYSVCRNATVYCCWPVVCVREAVGSFVFSVWGIQSADAMPSGAARCRQIDLTLWTARFRVRPENVSMTPSWWAVVLC